MASSDISYDLDNDLQQETYDREDAPMSRIQLLLLDYKQFLAARIIQRIWRAWHMKKQQTTKETAAIVIQRWFRGFHVRRHYFVFVEQTLQERCLQYYNNSATKIQAVFRGWRSRRYMQDFKRLQRLQISALEELLYSLAFKLHNMVRKHQLPGVYSMKGSKRLLKVEKLIALMQYRFHNNHMRMDMAIRYEHIKAARKLYVQSMYYTTVPYPGPNYQGFCAPVNTKPCVSNEFDNRMCHVIDIYENMQRDPLVRIFKNQITTKRMHKMKCSWKDLKEQNRLNYCLAVVKSIKKWKPVDGIQMSVNKEAFSSPENFQQFMETNDQYLSIWDTNYHSQSSNIPQMEADIVCH